MSMPVTYHITDGSPGSSHLDRFRAEQISRLPVAGRLNLKGRSGSHEQLGISRGYIHPHD